MDDHNVETESAKTRPESSPVNKNTPKVRSNNESTDLDKRLEYLLKLEEHADNFVEIKHRISLFVITSAVGSIGYTLNFSVARLSEVGLQPQRQICLVVGSLAALACVALALLSMYYDMQSYRLNLSTYAARKLYDELTDANKAKWGKINAKSTFCQRLAITTLFVSIMYQTALYVLLIFQ